MLKIIAHRTVKIGEMRDLRKLLTIANGKPVGIMHQQKLVGYFVPTNKESETEPISREELLAAMRATREKDQPVLDYLKDK